MAKPKITKLQKTEKPVPKITRVDNTEWKNSSPTSGSGQSWSAWAKSNPNRVAQAKIAEYQTDENSAGFEQTTTETRAGSKARKEAVSKWRGARPVSGAGGAKSDAEKEKKRQEMIRWAQNNPNKRTNALRTIKEDREAKAAAKPAARKKAAAPKKGKKK